MNTFLVDSHMHAFPSQFMSKGEKLQPLCPIASTGSIVAWAAAEHLILYNLESKTFELSLNETGHTDAIRSISISGNQIVTAGEDKKVIIWNRTFDGKWEISGQFAHQKKVMVALFDSENRIIFADKFGDIFRLRNEALRATTPDLKTPEDDEEEEKTESESTERLFGHLAAVSSALFSSKQGLLITADRDEKIRISQYPKSWIVDSFLFGHRRYVSALSFFGTDESKLVSAGADGMIMLWDISNSSDPKLIWALSVGEGPVNSIAVNGNKVLVVRTDDSDKIVVVVNGVLVETIACGTALQSVHALADGSIVAVDSNSHFVRVGGERIQLPRDVPGVPIFLMKVVHHENFDAAEQGDQRNRKKRKNNEDE